MNEGYIKFQCNWEKQKILIPKKLFLQLEKERAKLYTLGLIGMYPDGIGFGNISIRQNGGTFIISGSATGQFAILDESHYSLVTKYNFPNNSISCIGLTKASAESLTHAAVYETLPEVGAVVHVHCLKLWEKLLNIYPTTSGEFEYGTPEMALAVQSCVAKLRMKDEKIIIMGGHREGILAYGQNLEEATSQIIKIYNRYQND